MRKSRVCISVLVKLCPSFMPTSGVKPGSPG